MKNIWYKLRWLLWGPREITLGTGNMLIGIGDSDGRVGLFFRPTQPSQEIGSEHKGISKYDIRKRDTIIWLGTRESVDVLDTQLKEARTRIQKKALYPEIVAQWVVSVNEWETSDED